MLELEDEAKRETKLAAYFERIKHQSSSKKRHSQHLVSSPGASETEDNYDESQESERKMQEKIRKYEEKMLKATLRK
jgi:hypothetical protein